MRESGSARADATRVACHARHIDFLRRLHAQVLLLRNENPLLKKLEAVAHVEHGRLAARQQNDGRLLAARRLLLRPAAAALLTTHPLGLALAPLRLLFGGPEPLQHVGLKIAAGDAAPGGGVGHALLVLRDV